MNDRTFLQIQAIQLKELLDEAADDPILRPQLQERLDDTEAELRIHSADPTVPTLDSMPRAAIFLKGGGVQGNQGIRAALAGEALLQYERMFTEQAMNDERLAVRQEGRQRRKRGTPRPELLFTGTPRGSFGLEFTPEPTSDVNLSQAHSQSLRNVADALIRVTESETSLDQAVANLSPGLLRPMTRFLRVLANSGAELRLAFTDSPPRTIAMSQVKMAAERLEQEVDDEEISVLGVFRGLTRESMIFDLIPEDTGIGSLITGQVSESLTEADLERIDSLTNQRCIVQVHVTTVRTVSGSVQRNHVLLDARPE